jgi:hypothetical protein
VLRASAPHTKTDTGIATPSELSVIWHKSALREKCSDINSHNFAG